MHDRTRHAISAAMISGLVMMAYPAFAEGTTIKATLWDQGANGPMATQMGYDMPHADPAKAKMGIKLSAVSAPAGEITFEATNSSKVFVHEMIVVPAPAAGKLLPYKADEMRVDEDAAHEIGEVSETDPGKTGKVTLRLKAGKYLVLCNLPGHYAAGMWRVFTVTPAGTSTSG